MNPDYNFIGCYIPSDEEIYWAFVKYKMSRKGKKRGRK